MALELRGLLKDEVSEGGNYTGPFRLGRVFRFYSKHAGKQLAASR